MLKKVVFSLVLVMSLFLIGCSHDPILAFFTDGTSAGSDNYTINVDFVSDDRFTEKFVDILILSQAENLEIEFKREFDKNTTLHLQEKDTWYSLTELLNNENGNKEEKFMPFSDKSDMTLVIKSTQKATIKLKAVSGDVQENSTGNDLLINQVEISKEFSLDLGRNIKD